MRRRDLLVWTAAVGGTFAGRAILGQGSAGQRAAVVIGVNRAGNLPALSAAVSGAEQISNWLKAEGFEVELFVDRHQGVEVNRIFDCVAEFVKRGTVTLLVIYFAGHGFVIGYSEFWLLSKAPDNPNEAICCSESFSLARQSGIPNVVFISDACRSTADSLGTTRVTGSLIFPNPQVQPNLLSDVDQFLATRVGNPAWEIPVYKSVPNFQGVFTASFLSAFKHPTEDMVATVDGVNVVPNRKLKNYLLSDVPRRARAKSIKLEQHPDSQVVSDETIYIGRVSAAAVAAAPPPPQGIVTIVDVAQDAITRAVDVAQDAITRATDMSDATSAMPPRHRHARAHHAMHGKMAGHRGVQHRGHGPRLEASPAPAEQRARIESVARKTGFLDSKKKILQVPPQGQFETKTGFSISGAQLRSVTAIPQMRAVILNPGDGAGPALVQTDLGGQHVGSIALQFADGSGTVVAALADYVGNVVVEKGGVTNVSYVPAQNSYRWSKYQSEREWLDQLRAAVAAAAASSTVLSYPFSGVELAESQAGLVNARSRTGEESPPSGSLDNL